MSKLGTPLQVLKFASQHLNDADAAVFVNEWLAGTLFHEMWSTKIGFEQFCKENPDLPDRGDGRKVHYGAGRQPIDDIRDAGWAPQFDAGNILKYLRRDKDVEHSRESARWYWRDLNVMCGDSNIIVGHRAVIVRDKLMKMLTANELAFLRDG